MVDAITGVQLNISGAAAAFGITCVKEVGAPGIGVKSVPFVDDEIITF